MNNSKKLPAKTKLGLYALAIAVLAINSAVTNHLTSQTKGKESAVTWSLNKFSLTNSAAPADKSLNQMKKSAKAAAQQCAAMAEMAAQGYTPPYTCGK